jgi:hypothetical protein
MFGRPERELGFRGDAVDRRGEERVDNAGDDSSSWLALNEEGSLTRACLRIAAAAAV